jgi:hypothetical protein
MYTRGSIALQGVSFYARAGMDVWTNGGAFCWNAHSNYSSISGSALNNTVGFALMQVI